MLMGWWQVKLSSGCPLASGAGCAPYPAMGRRSRSARAAREPKARVRPLARARAGGRARPARRAPGERPPAPWGSFPLVELCVLLALVIGVVGFIRAGPGGGVMLAAALALGSLAGLEFTIREHFAGYRSHTTLLAGLAAEAGDGRWSSSPARHRCGDSARAGLFVFVAAYYLLRELFKRRSGGRGFRMTERAAAGCA